jgi:hypothetical protein
MPLNIESLSASERKRIADAIVAMSPDQQKELVELLGNIQSFNAKSESETTRKKAAIERINAAKADAFGGRATIDLLNGTLKRGGLPPVEQLVEKQPDEILKLFSASTMATADKIACKTTLHKLKVIP